ncbi:MAG TPA: 2-hydroxyacyl-CoA dehydratase family protein [Candidatus Hydrogenedens sp.]|nr:2-hydroxyacyl-CoA dehydratase family protein [Candidatus Hydrogenedens sp.]
MSLEVREFIKPFVSVSEDLYYFSKQAKKNGEMVAGFMCTYSPQELFHAAGYFPVRIIGKDGGTPLADQWLQPYACSFAKSVLNMGLSGDYPFLDLMVFSHTCDTMQNLADVWRRRVNGPPVIIVSTPNLSAGDLSLTYLKRELTRVKEEVEKISGNKIADDKLLNSINLYNKHRDNMKLLYDMRRKSPTLITGTEMFAIVLSSFVMKKEEHNKLLEELIQQLEKMAPENIAKPKILVGGSVCQAQGFIQTIESSGALVCDDDLCMGSRAYVIPSVPEGDPIEMLAQMYLLRIPCPAIHKPGYDPAGPYIDKIKAGNIDGVIFLQTKFCDPYGFNYPYLRKRLEQEGIPSLLLEVEQNQPVAESFHTRVEAFIETLSAK